jgi:4-amino-4-deoxy-L-arabinose transferase-like glycosyltransferase
MSRLAAAYRVTERFWWGMRPRAIVILVVVLTVARGFIADRAGLLWDEAYYWMWSQHPAAGYFDHPPMVAWWIAASTAIFGNSPTALRLPFILNVAIAPFVGYALARILFDRAFAWRSALWATVLPVVGIAGFMATPDGPAVTFWSLAIVCFALVVRTGNGVWWLAVGVFAGLGVLSKYTVLFLGPGLVLALLIDPPLRRWFLSPWLWAGGAIAVLIFLPNVLWNAEHDWVSYRFQFGRLGEARFTPVYLLTLLVVQPLIFNPLAAVFMVRGVRMWLAGAQYGREIGILVATALPAAMFIVFQATHGEVLQHWLTPVFPTLTVVAVVAASTIPDGEDHWILRRLRADVVPLGLTAAVVVWAYAILPLDRFYPSVDPLNSLRGWPQYADEVEQLRVSRGATWIATTDYNYTGGLTYHLRDRAVVVPITERVRYQFQPLPHAEVLAGPALVVLHRGGGAETIAGCFNRFTEIAILKRRGAGQTLATSHIYIGEGVSPEAFDPGCDRRQ